MKLLNISKKGKIAFFSLMAIGLISLDFITCELWKQHRGTYRYESEFDAITAATVSVGMVPSDYDSLKSPAARTANLTKAQVDNMVAWAVKEAGGFRWNYRSRRCGDVKSESSWSQ